MDAYCLFKINLTFFAQFVDPKNLILKSGFKCPSGVQVFTQYPLVFLTDGPNACTDFENSKTYRANRLTI